VDKKTRDTVALKKIFDAFQNATDAQVRTRTRSRARVLTGPFFDENTFLT
jgi:hypothetical protein